MSDARMEYGIALSKAMETVDALCEDEITAATAKGLLAGYHSRWSSAHQHIELIDIEKTLLAPLTNLETLRDSRTYQLGGKIDKDCYERGDRVIYDHKTTSMDIESPDAPYWRQLVIESQPSQYTILMGSNGHRIDRAVWDVIRKPQIRPRKLTKAERATAVSLHTYCGSTISKSSRELALEDGCRENGELFALRVAKESIENPGKYFARRSVPRTNEELAEFNQELWDIGQEIRETKHNGRHFRNPGACMNYGTPCVFLGVCSGHDTVDSDRWTRKEQVHSELELEGDGKSVLTNSRIRTFQTCRRKHYYQYEEGLERAESEESQALFFGNVMHYALDAWWETIYQEMHNGNAGTPANEADQCANGKPPMA